MQQALLLQTQNQYFNSIKVQLRLVSNKVPIVVTTFQFHKGTIKT